MRPHMICHGLMLSLVGYCLTYWSPHGCDRGCCAWSTWTFVGWRCVMPTSAPSSDTCRHPSPPSRYFHTTPDRIQHSKPCISFCMPMPWSAARGVAVERTLGEWGAAASSGRRVAPDPAAPACTRRRLVVLRHDDNTTLHITYVHCFLVYLSCRSLFLTSVCQSCLLPI